jgi:hypothetical protein
VRIRGVAAPTITWLLPLHTSCVRRQTTLAVAASAPTKIRVVRFFDGGRLIAARRKGTVGLFTASWTTRKVKRGVHVLRAVVVTADGSVQARRVVKVCG